MLFWISDAKIENSFESGKKIIKQDYTWPKKSVLRHFRIC